LGLCEIENNDLAKDLISAMGKENDFAVAEYHDSPDIRSIDTCLIFNKKLFRFMEAESFNVNIRYPTRDIFKVHLSVLNNNSELVVLVNHWPSRTMGRYESEPLRIAVAENCARAIDKTLKFSVDELFSITNLRDSLDSLNQKLNKNVLVMGDFNDNPFDKSIIDYLRATSNKDLLIE